MENQQQQNSPLCRAGCGFYGSSATENLCSKCFKDAIKRKQEAPGMPPQSGNTTHQSSSSSSKPGTPTPTGDSESVSDASTSTNQTTVQAQQASAGVAEEPKSSAEESIATTAKSASSATAIQLTSSDSIAQGQKKPNRCSVCNKRVGLTGFECRCGGLYCGEHRYDTAHNCTFDYKTAGREELRKKHPVVVKDKVQRI